MKCKFSDKLKIDKFFLRTTKKYVIENLLEGHKFHWICLLVILAVCLTGNCYQVYHAIQDLSKNVSDIDITYPTNYSVPSITMCFPVLALLNTQCLKRKDPNIIRKIENKFPDQKGDNLLKELYSEIIKTESDSRLILNEFYLRDLYSCLDKPRIDMINNTFSILQFKSIRESFKLDLFCLSFNFDKAYVDKKEVLKKRIMKSFLELTILPTPLKYVDYIKFFLHDSQDEQNDYLLWYYKLIKFDIFENNYKNHFGISYLHYINILEKKCIKNGKITYHYTKEKFSTAAHMQEDCLSRDFVSILKYPYGDTRLPVEFIFDNPNLNLKLFKPDKASFEGLNKRYNFTRMINNCFKMVYKKACQTSIFIPELKYSFRKDNDNITFLLIPPGEPDMEVKSAPRLTNFEFATFIMSVICCWLQFSLFGFVYSLIAIKKNLNEIELKLKKEN